MKATIIESQLTKRVIKLKLSAESFEEERILKFLVDSLASDGTLFTMTSDAGEPRGIFRLEGNATEGVGHE